MSRTAKPDLTTLIGRTIKEVHQHWYPKEPCRSGEWYVEYITLDDGTELAFSVVERENELIVDLIHRKGVRQ